MKRTDEPIVRSLYKDSKNIELIWNCHHPKGLAEIMYNGNIHKGFGYSETLFSLIKPWNLPIDELRWGRFLSDSYTLIWINWLGKYPVNKIFFNGTEFNDAIFKNIFVQRKDIGNEYFEGDYKYMIDIIYLSIKNDKKENKLVDDRVKVLEATVSEQQSKIAELEAKLSRKKK